MEFKLKIVKVDRGQALLEFVVVFIIMGILLLSLFNIWLWSTRNIVRRQKEYNNQRVDAGSSSPGSPQVPYNAPDLSERDILYFR